MSSWTPPAVDPHDEPQFSCAACLDCGWELFWCAGGGPGKTWERPRGYTAVPSRPCGRPKAHARHAFVERCQCWLTNPVIQRRREKEAEKRRNKGAA